MPGVVNPSALQLEWRGQGLLGQGRARLGERVLVWAGTVPGPWLTDTLDITLQARPQRHAPARRYALALRALF